MINEDWEDIDLRSVESLIDADVTEGKTMEFKRQLSPDTTGHKAKFLGEVTSFANDRGGDLVIGLVEEEGAATTIWPMDIADPDAIKDRWANIIQNKTDPPLSSSLVEIKTIEVRQGATDRLNENANSTGFILLVRTESSWRSPHRERYNNRFYGRSASGKMELDTGAVRREMLQGQETADRVHRFRNGRAGDIQVDEGSLRLVEEPLLLLHTIPSDAFVPTGGIDPKAASEERDVPRILASPNRSLVSATRYMADGYLKSTTPNDEGRFRGYTSIFRSGIIETVSNTAAAPESDRLDDRDGFYISSMSARSALENYLPETVQFLNDGTV